MSSVASWAWEWSSRESALSNSSSVAFSAVSIEGNERNTQSVGVIPFVHFTLGVGEISGINEVSGCWGHNVILMSSGCGGLDN